MPANSCKRITWAGWLLAAALATAGCSGISNFPWQSNLPPAQQRIEKKADAGDRNAQYSLGLYYSSSADHTDYAKAADWYRKAADQGHAGAQYMLGQAYLVGRGITRDETSAVRWLERAARQGHGRAMYSLGDIYFNGRGVVEDQAWGVMWFGKAAARNHREAMLSLGIALAVGKGTDIDTPLAWAWLKKAEEQGHPDAPRAAKALEVDFTAQTMERARKTLASLSSRPVKDFHQDIPMVRYVQTALNLLRYNVGSTDGLLGPRTLTALNSYKKDAGLPLQPVIGDALLTRLRKTTENMATQS